MTHSQPAPGREVLYKWSAGELSFPKVPEPDRAATSVLAKNKKSPKPREHFQFFRLKGFYSSKC